LVTRTNHNTFRTDHYAGRISYHTGVRMKMETLIAMRSPDAANKLGYESQNGPDSSMRGHL